jgi:hypothetical protein
MLEYLKSLRDRERQEEREGGWKEEKDGGGGLKNI